jgi:hypothetical protein
MVSWLLSLFAAERAAGTDARQEGPGNRFFFPSAGAGPPPASADALHNELPDPLGVEGKTLIPRAWLLPALGRLLGLDVYLEGKKERLSLNATP